MATQQTSSKTTMKWTDLFEKNTAQNETKPQQKEHVIATIEIHHEDQPQQQPEKKSKKQEVNTLALRVAEFIYTTYLDKITKTGTRPALEQFFKDHFNQEIHDQLAKSEIGYSEVIYALARGMKVVNVFRPPNQPVQELGWHTPEEKYRKAHKESKKRLHPKKDGWTDVGVSMPQIERSDEPVAVHDSQIPVEKASLIETTENTPIVPDQSDTELDDDAIMNEIKTLKTDMENHLCAIDSLVPLHDDHVDRITILEGNPCAVAKRVVDYHIKAKNELVTVLDTLQMELDKMKARKIWLCEKLKL
jgi:hypothetical protein